VRVEINLIGQPTVETPDAQPYRPRSRKTWAALGYLVLTERPPSRGRLSSLLFGEADDPLRALRWSLTELRRVLGDEAELRGDPVGLVLPAQTTVDVRLITSGRWQDAIALPNLGEDLLANVDMEGAPEFDSWLLAQRRHVAASTEDVLREATLALLARGDVDEALRLAVTLVGLNPYRESHQAVLIRAYLMSGDEAAANRQYEACTELFVRELGVAPGPSVRAAMQAPEIARPVVGDGETIDAIIEAGLAALSGGVPEAAAMSLRSGVALADSVGDTRRQATTRLALARAVSHSSRGGDEEGAMLLHAAGQKAREAGDEALYARTSVELAYRDMLAARYDRAEQWLVAENLPSSDAELRARADCYLGCLESDRAEYQKAEELLGRAVDYLRAAGIHRGEAYAASLLGRMHFLRGDLDAAANWLETAMERNSAIAFVPWPQSFLGEVALERGDRESAARHLEQAFARACQMGDPCWEGTSARALALLAEARGETTRAFAGLQDASDRCDRRSDTYVWAKAYILDAQCSLGIVHGHDRTPVWADSLYDLAAGTGMREFQLKAMVYRTASGIRDERRAAADLARDIANPRLVAMATTV
jgi:DNA-binding SARP family transcriptional activator